MFIEQKIVEILASNGYTIVQVMPYGDENSLWYIAHQFTPAFKSASEVISYHVIKGVNITDFIHQHAKNPDIVNMNARLTQLLADSNTKIMRVEFADNIKWFKYASAI